MLHANQQQSWSVKVRAKSKNFDFRLKVSESFTICKLFRFSVQFKLHPYLFKIKSKPQSSFSWKPKFLRQKFLQIFRVKRPENNGIVRTMYAHKGSVFASAALLATGVPDHLCKLISEHYGFTIFNSLLIFLSLFGLVLKHLWLERRKIRNNWLIVPISAMFGCFIILQLSNHFNNEGFSWKYFWCHMLNLLGFQ